VEEVVGSFDYAHVLDNFDRALTEWTSPDLEPLFYKIQSGTATHM